MKVVSKYIIFIVAMSLSLSCKRQTLEDPHYAVAEVPITIDWSQSLLGDDYVDNVSIYFYPYDGGDPYITISGNIDSLSVDIPVGYYSIAIFNDVAGSISGIDIANIDSYSSFSAGVVEDSNPSDIYYQIQDSDRVVYSHNQMAAWRMDKFAVTSDMLKCSCGVEYISDTTLLSTATTPLLDLQPTPLTAINTISVRVVNLSNASIIEGALIGSANGRYVASNSAIGSGASSNVSIFSFASKVYDQGEDATDGVIKASVITFGKQPSGDATYSLELNIILGSGTLESFTFDVTDQVVESEPFNIIIDLTDSTNMVVLPEGNASSFGVEDWGDTNLFELL